MKTKNIFSLISLFIICVFFFGACSGCSHSDTPKATHRATHEDTIRTLNMTKEFMETLKNGDVDGAINMLSEIKNDSVRPLNDTVRAYLQQYFAQFPVKEYEVQTSDFTNVNLQTVTYRYRFMDNPTDDPNFPVYTHLAIDAKMKNGQWRVMLHNYKYISKDPHQKIRTNADGLPTASDTPED